MIERRQQSRWDSYRKIIKYHGVYRGARRVLDQYLQINLYDDRHATNFAQILSGDQYYSSIDTSDQAAIMYYQPVFTASVKRPLKYLVQNYPIVGASSACFIDLGCGRGKSLHVARSVLQHITVMGIDLIPLLLMDAAKNLGIKAQAAGSESELLSLGEHYGGTKVKLIASNVNDADYESLLSAHDVIIVFNKNSFDKHTTENTLDQIRQCSSGKKIFYIYSNPVFEDSFGEFKCIFGMSGWHKNWNTKVFEIS